MDTLERLRVISESLSTTTADRQMVVTALSSKDPDIARTATEVAAELVAAQPSPLASQLLDLLVDARADVDARCNAAIAFGPSLEMSDMEGFGQPGSQPPLERSVFDRIVATLEKTYDDRHNPDSLRRASLEAAVRAIEPPWLLPAVRQAFRSNDSPWVETALFCSRYLEADFTPEVLSSLSHDDPSIVFAAVFASVEVHLPPAALRRVTCIVDDATISIVVRCSALEALAAQPSEEAGTALGRFMHSDDPIIADKAAYLMSWREGYVDSA